MTRCDAARQLDQLVADLHHTDVRVVVATVEAIGDRLQGLDEAAYRNTLEALLSS